MIARREMTASLAPVKLPLATARDLADARRVVVSLARRLGFGVTAEVQLATAVSETVRNVLMYAGVGELNVRVTLKGLHIEVWDSGPGIPLEVLQSLEEGTYRSRTGLGKGIQGCKRIMDRFSLISMPGRTQVIMEKHLHPR